MDIASAVVHAMPCSRDEVRSQLQGMPGLQIHAETPDGRFIVTVEDTPEASAVDKVMNLHSLRGVLSADMVYQHSDQAIDTEEDSP
jgi:nitrate reductase NapD